MSTATCSIAWWRERRTSIDEPPTEDRLPSRAHGAHRHAPLCALQWRQRSNGAADRRRDQLGGGRVLRPRGGRAPRLSRDRACRRRRAAPGIRSVAGEPARSRRRSPADVKMLLYFSNLIEGRERTAPSSLANQTLLGYRSRQA